MKNVIYTQNAEVQTVAVNTPLDLGAVKRRYGQHLKYEANKITALGAGYYNVDVSATLAGTVAGLGTLRVLVNGEIAAEQSATLAVGESMNISMPLVIRNYCYAPIASIQIVTDGVAVPTVDNLYVRVEEV